MGYDMTEMNKLENYLILNGIDYERRYYRGGDIIEVYDNGKDNERTWDAIINDLSYGRQSGLLEISGNIVDRECDDSVEGWLTAKDVIERYERVYKKPTSLEITVEDAKHLKNYLTFALKYLKDQLYVEHDRDMADVIIEELYLAMKYQEKLNSFIH